MNLTRKAFFCFLIVMVVLYGCSSKKRRKADYGGGPEKLYAKGLSLYNGAKFQSALDVFKDVKSYYPESSQTLRAEIKIADCDYFLERYEEAIPLYEEFRKLHPYHEDIPYVIFQIGQAYFQQIRSSDRDPTPARNALSNFEYLVKNYPSGIFAEASKKKIQTCIQCLAEHEFMVGMFYYKKGKYQGAARRFEGLIAQYPDAELAPKALFYLGNAYLRLNLKDKAKAAFVEITRRYPGSEYFSKSNAILGGELSQKEIQSNTVSRSE